MIVTCEGVVIEYCWHSVAARVNDCAFLNSRRLKGFRRIFSRFENLDLLFLGFLTFALNAEALR